MNNDLIDRYLRGECTLEERIAVTRWAAESPDNREQIVAARRLYESTLLNTEEESSRKKHFPKWLRWTLSSVAAASVAAAGVFIGHKSVEPVGQSPFAARTIEVPVGQRVHTVLSDGTSVWLNSNSRLELVADGGGFRKVRLDGEALFDVSHDESRPFVVETERNSVTVLGTTFDVSAYGDSGNCSVKLYEGSVSLSDSDGSEICRLAPFQRVDIIGDGYMMSGMNPNERELWTEGIYFFDDKTYSEIFRTVQSYYKTRITIEDAAVADFKCTCRVRQEDGLEHLLNVLNLVHPFRWRWNSDRTEVRLSLK